MTQSLDQLPPYALKLKAEIDELRAEIEARDEILRHDVSLTEARQDATNRELTRAVDKLTEAVKDQATERRSENTQMRMFLISIILFAIFGDAGVI